MKRYIVGIIILCLSVFSSIYFIAYIINFWSEIFSVWYGGPTIMIIGIILLVLDCGSIALIED